MSHVIVSTLVHQNDLTTLTNLVSYLVVILVVAVIVAIIVVIIMVNLFAPVSRANLRIESPFGPQIFVGTTMRPSSGSK